MKVLFISRNYIGLSKGGLQKQIEHSANCLRDKGVNVIYHNSWENQIDDVDLCHLWSSCPDMTYHLGYAKRSGIPTVISPVFMRFEDPMWQVFLEYNLGRCFKGLLTPQRRIGHMISSCDKVIALNKEEAHYLKKVLHVKEDRIRIIPNGINKKFSAGDPSLFEKKYGFKDFVLQVGSLDSRKNALRTIKAMSKLPYKLVLIGPHEGSEDYYRQCKDAANENVLFMGQVDNNDPILASAYAAAKTFVLPAFSEVMPLVVYEAAQAGCNLVMSKTYPCEDNIRE